MIRLHTLSIVNFRNCEEASIIFSDKFNCLVGLNGEGKTSVLDAIHYLSLTRSFINPVDSQNIRYEQPFFMIQGVFEKNGNKEIITCSFKRNEKKQLKRNQKEYEKLADHVGFIPVVILSPLDTALILEGSEERRKFIDSLFSQLDQRYLHQLLQYNRALQQRNILLKQFAEKHFFDELLLEGWNDQLAESGNYIFSERKKLIQDFIPVFQDHYARISGTHEQVSLQYESQLFKDDFTALLKGYLNKDRALEYTSVGIHKDDLVFLLDGNPLKKFASQGQQKTFLASLKLAQYHYMQMKSGESPILLLDDLFDKLDRQRVEGLLKIVAADNFGQVFITDTDKTRIFNIIGNLHVPVKVFQVKKGKVIEDEATQ